MHFIRGSSAILTMGRTARPVMYEIFTTWLTQELVLVSADFAYPLWHDKAFALKRLNTFCWDYFQSVYLTYKYAKCYIKHTNIVRQ